MEQVTEDEATIIIGALVCRIDVARWSSIKAAVSDAGGRLIFQKIAAPGVHLRIVEEPR
jgi:hypothetical protein